MTVEHFVTLYLRWRKENRKRGDANVGRFRRRGQILNEEEDEKDPPERRGEEEGEPRERESNAAVAVASERPTSATQ